MTGRARAKVEGWELWRMGGEEGRMAGCLSQEGAGRASVLRCSRPESPGAGNLGDLGKDEVTSLWGGG